MSHQIQMNMRDEWNQIAGINAYFGIDAISEFENANDLDENLFWERGRNTAAGFLSRMQLEDTSKWTMVEIGCGLGRMTHYFAEKFSKVYAIDVSPIMLAGARKKWGHLINIEFVLGSGKDLKPIKRRSVNFVFSFIVLQHVLDSSIVLNYIRETSRVLKPGGLSFMQFRTFTPQIDPAPDFLIKMKRIFPKKLKNQIKKMPFFHPEAVRPDPKPSIVLPKNLEEKYNQEFKVWRGCKVSTYDVRKIVRKCGLRIKNAEGENTQYTFYTFQKEG